MSGDKKNIHFLAASDRINYGDLLFPIIFKSVLDKLYSNVIFKNYGIVKSNLSNFGGIKTESYKSLQSDLINSKGVLIICGGEVLFPTWTLIYSYINVFFKKLLGFRVFNKIEKNIFLVSFCFLMEKTGYPLHLILVEVLKSIIMLLEEL